MITETTLPKKENILRYPRLDTILMVEEFIKRNDGEFKKRKLWESLPKKMMYQTYKIILEYLEESSKIIIDKDNIVIWIYDKKNISKILSLGVKLR